MTKFDLTFTGSASVRAYKLPRYRRQHESLEAARVEAAKVRARMERKGLPAAAHHPVIYGSDGKQYV